MIAPVPSADGTRLVIKGAPSKCAAAAHAINGAVLGPEYVDIPWTLSAAKQAYDLGLNAVAPIFSGFDWGAALTPYPQQKKIVNFCALNPRGFVFVDMRLGKTAALVWAVKFLRQHAGLGKVLVVCPLTVAFDAWMPTLQSMRESAYVAAGTPGAKPVRTDTDWVVCNYDGVVTHADELKSMGFDCVIIDESRAYARKATNRFKALLPISAKARFCWAAVATPLSGGPMDAHGQASIVHPHTFTMPMTKFRALTMFEVAPQIWKPAPHGMQVAEKYLRPAIRISRSDIKNVATPPVHKFIEVPLSAGQALAMKQLREEGLADINNGLVSAVNAGVRRTKLLQIAGGVVFSDDQEPLHLDATARIDLVKQIVAQKTHGVLILASYRQIAAKLWAALGNSFAEINGSVPAAKRIEIIKAVQAGTLKGIVAVPGTMSHGVTLTSADTVIWFTPPAMGADTYWQANARIDALHKERPMEIINIYGSTIEKLCYNNTNSAERAQKEFFSHFKQFALAEI